MNALEIDSPWQSKDGLHACNSEVAIRKFIEDGEFEENHFLSVEERELSISITFSTKSFILRWSFIRSRSCSPNCLLARE